MEKSVTRPSGWTLKPDTFQLEISHELLTLRVIDHWNKLPRDLVDSPSLGAFRSSLATFLEGALVKHKVLGSMQGEWVTFSDVCYAGGPMR